MKRLEDLPDVLTVPQAAKFLGISSGTCYGMVAQGKIPAKKFGKRVLISKRELATYLGYGDVPKIEVRMPKRVIVEIAELARSMSQMTERLARICEMIGGEYGGSDERSVNPAPGARNQEPESAAFLR